jgi:predicted nucleic acid-binding Zn ribbon protein
MSERKCLECGVEITGRVDKQFCGTKCQQRYWKKKEQEKIRVSDFFTIYHKKDVIIVLESTSIDKKKHKELLQDDWQPTTTLNPARFIEYLYQNKDNATIIIRAIKNLIEK